MNKLFLFYILLLLSCRGKSQHEEKPSTTTYHNRHINWTITIPAGWKIKEWYTNNKKDTLYDFVKSQYNEFSFTAWQYAELKPGDYNLQVAKEHLDYYNGITATGLRADTSSGKELIGGLEFITFSLTAYPPATNLPVTQIIFYSRLMRGRNFHVSIQFNNEAHFKDIYAAFKNCKFE